MQGKLPFPIITKPFKAVPSKSWVFSSAGRAPVWRTGGHRFDPCSTHHDENEPPSGGFFRTVGLEWIHSMKYPYTHRKAIPFCFLNFITFGIYGCVVLSRVDQEMNHLVIGYDDYKTTPRYWPWYVLGWATFMIAPFVWQIRLASKLGRFAKEMKVGSPRLSGLSFAMWSTFGTLILVGPFIAWHRVFSLLNFLEDAANHESEVRELAKIKSQNGEPNVLFASMEECSCTVKKQATENNR